MHTTRDTALGVAAVIPVLDGRALLTIEADTNGVQYGVLNGDRCTNKTVATTAANAAWALSGHAISTSTYENILGLKADDFYHEPEGNTHVAIVHADEDDRDAPWDHYLFNTVSVCF